jgi:hypothetical protein
MLCFICELCHFSHSLLLFILLLYNILCVRMHISVEYFDDQKCSKALGAFHLHSDVRIMTRDGFTHLFKFAIMSKNDRIEVSASSESERQAWISMITKVCRKDDIGGDADDNCQSRPSSVALLRSTEEFNEADMNIYANTDSILLDDGITCSSSSFPPLPNIDASSVLHESELQSEYNETSLIFSSTSVSAATSTSTAAETNTNINTNTDTTYCTDADADADSDVPITRSRVLTMDMISMLTPKDQARQNLTLEVLRKQLRAKGELPLEFIPLDELQAEVATIFEKVNSGETFDEDRLDYLLHCLELNPEHKAKLKKEKEQWAAEVLPYTHQCFQEMRGFIPSHIFDSSIISLVDEDGLSKVLAKRFFMKKCLMLIRLMKDDISKMHIAELSGRFNPSAQGLDIVEMAAIYYALPDFFLNDHDGKKEQWKASIEEAFKKLYSQKVANNLPKNLVRFNGYLKETPFFKDDDKYHTFSKESSATDDSENFLKVSKQKSEKLLAVSESDGDNKSEEQQHESKPSADVTSQEAVGKNNRKTMPAVGNELLMALKVKRSSMLTGGNESRKPLKANALTGGGGAGAGAGSGDAMQDELRNVLQRRSQRKLMADDGK